MEKLRSAVITILVAILLLMTPSLEGDLTQQSVAQREIKLVKLKAIDPVRFDFEGIGLNKDDTNVFKAAWDITTFFKNRFVKNFTVKLKNNKYFAQIAALNTKLLRVPEDFPTIQDAINNARPGDLIEVNAALGPYRESIRINGSNLTLRSVNGRAVIESQSKASNVIEVVSNFVTIKGFEVRNGYGGIVLIKVNGVTLEDNIAIGNELVGIGLIDSKGNALISNRTKPEKGDDIGIAAGIALGNSDNNRLERNFTEGHRFGISLINSSENILKGNVAKNNRSGGIQLENNCEGNILNGNLLEGNGWGIVLAHSSGNTLIGNIAKVNREEGIRLVFSDDNEIKNNGAKGSNFGIALNDSTGNIMEGNTAMGNSQVGILLDNSDQNELIGNKVVANNDSGIKLQNFSKYNVLQGNTVGNNRWGILLVDSGENRVEGNTAKDNKEEGITLIRSDENTLRVNTVEDNDFGFVIEDSNRNTLEANKAMYNVVGIDIRAGVDNVLRANTAEYNDVGILVNNSIRTILEDNIAQHNKVANIKMLDLVEGELLVRFKKRVPQELIDSIIKDLDTEVIRFFPVFNIYHLRIIADADADATLRKVDDFNAIPEVDIAEPNIRMELASNQGKPNDEAFWMQWNLLNEGQRHPSGAGGEKAGKKGVDIGIIRAWEAGFTDSRDVAVIVIDSGIDLEHPDLIDNLLKVYSYDFVRGDEAPEDNIGHGTFITGIIGAKGNNGQDISGISWQSTMIPLKASDKLSFLEELKRKIIRFFFGIDTDEFINAMQFTIVMKTGVIPANIEMSAEIKGRIEEKRSLKNIKVINFSAVTHKRSDLLEDVIKKAGEAGILFITAAGNYGENNDEKPLYPCNYPLENIICVGASTDEDELAEFSNYGTASVDLVAPGEDIVSLIPPLIQTGQGVLHQEHFSKKLEEEGFEGLAVISGTSFAAAHVSGVAALLFAICPEKSALEIKEIILRNVEKNGNLEGKVLSGGRLRWPELDKLLEEECKVPSGD
jgi:parallel beta-helix repeat protein